MSDDAEYSESGVRIYRHEAKDKAFQIAEGDAEALGAIEEAAPLLSGDEFRSLKVSASKTINVYAPLPIYKEEMVSEKKTPLVWRE